jgi:hypothetical protein
MYNINATKHTIGINGFINWFFTPPCLRDRQQELTRTYIKLWAVKTKIWTLDHPKTTTYIIMMVLLFTGLVILSRLNLLQMILTLLSIYFLIGATALIFSREYIKPPKTIYQRIEETNKTVENNHK